MKVAINGTGIAGSTLAYWLYRYGHEPVLIEHAAGPRSGGYIVDFWGHGYDVATMMGIVPRLRESGYGVEEVRFVGSDGRRRGSFSTEVIKRTLSHRFVSLTRSDLASAIYATIDGKVETIFGDSITTIDDGARGLHVGFDHHPSRRFDLVVGADGLHSRVRELRFGREEQFEFYLGYKAAAFELPGYRPRDELTYVSYAEPGRQVSRFSMRDDKTLFLFVYRDPNPGDRLPMTDDGRKAALHDVFGDVGWECQHILKAMEGVGDIYFDRVSQIRMDSWIKGRTVLVGDSGACVSLLAGEGSGLAMTEAYVLAGELAHARDNASAGLAHYQLRLMPFLQDKQKTASRFASSFVPKTGFGIALRNCLSSLMVLPFIADLLLGRQLQDDFRLPAYAVH
ncbi:FAD-binding domain [Rhizobium sp. P32RR-XVIII]|uniref:FAD-binding domain n=1 Tax=Rhizobium sp. P32RR-XVIII TaxID=2726738 RepID=UPI001456F7F1|nr:FAD-binding domain [Rhizobium sp. P32RR-XVIII]NLS07966.1 FAD-binding domain [Rhizobium sp. P32RR-XVIII]